MLWTRLDRIYAALKTKIAARTSFFLGFMLLCGFSLAWYAHVTADKFADQIGPYATALMVLCYVSPVFFLIHAMWNKKGNPPERLGEIIDSWGTMAIKLVIYSLFLVSSLWQLMQSPVYWSSGMATYAAALREQHPLAYWLFLFLLGDFIYYWGHRLSHTTGLGWAFHRSHHTMPRLTLANGPRSESLNIFLAFMPSLFSFALGLPIVDISYSVMINVGIQLLILHTEMNWPKNRLLEFLVNVPSHHRVHHYIHPLALDKNYSGILIIWDRLFGTFQAEQDIPFDEQHPKEYGIIGSHKLDDPISIMFGGLVHFSKSCQQAGSPRELWRLLISPPGAPTRPGQVDGSTRALLASYQKERASPKRTEQGSSRLGA
jgi:sterol desaturase/sphingolipid hydroxylase (fatty acid hydroxylase superfamily)